MSEDIVRPESTPPSSAVDEQAPPSPFPKPAGNPTVNPAHLEEPEEDDAFVWTAVEYIAHHKDSKWYASVMGITLLAVIIIYAITRDVISGVTIFVLGILFCLAAARKPRILTYALDDHGLTIGPRFYPYDGFRSFSAVREGTIVSIELIPLKRFMPVTSVSCPPANEETVAAIISDHVPYEERPHALIDRFGRYIRF